MTDFCTKLERYLRTKNPVGCSRVEISELERRFHVCLPESYRCFLRLAGRGAEVWTGSDFHFNFFDAMHEGALEILHDEGLTLPPGAFVFYMHQGYVFFALSQTGEILHFQEGDAKLERRYARFEDFFWETAEVSE